MPSSVGVIFHFENKMQSNSQKSLQNRIVMTYVTRDSLCSRRCLTQRSSTVLVNCARRRASSLLRAPLVMHLRLLTHRNRNSDPSSVTRYQFQLRTGHPKRLATSLNLGSGLTTCGFPTLFNIGRSVMLSV